MRKINPDHIEAVIKEINQAPYFRLLSITISELGLGYANLNCSINEKHHHPFQGVHGGVFCSVIDTAAFWAAYCEADENRGLITLDVNTNILGSVSDGDLTVTGRCLKKGRTIFMTEATATNSDGKLVATGTSKLLASDDLPSVQSALESISGQSLPPKFLE
jgi:uncharacterized protein (TIGR00369 family)